MKCLKCFSYFSGNYCKICDEPPAKKRPKPIRKASLKRVEKNKDYSKLRLVYLEQFTICEVYNCWQPSTEIHHVEGRENDKQNDVENFLAVCKKCHEYIHDNHAWAVRHGYKRLRSN